MCFVFLFVTKHFANCIVLELSQYNVVGFSIGNPILLNTLLLQTISHAPVLAAMYSASAVLLASTVCLRENQFTGPLPKNIMNPLVDFRVSISPAKSESV